MNTSTQGNTALAEMSCQEAVELLPWLLNGTLEADERQQVRSHLETCDDCRRELDDTAQAWQLMNQHIPSLTLAELAHGLEPQDLDRERIEHHLALCPSCSQELEQATPSTVVDFETARVERARFARLRRWASRENVARKRFLAVAASITLAVVSGAVIVNHATTPDRRALETDRDTSTLVEQAHPQPADLFSDGFETGGTATWSSVNL